MNKKIIIIIAVVLGIVAMSAGIYFAWKKSKEILTPPVADIEHDYDYNYDGQSFDASNDQQQPDLAKNKIKILSDKPVFGYWIYRQNNVISATSSADSEGISLENSVIFYLSQDGLIFKVKEEGEDELVVSQSINDAQFVKGSFDGRLALFKFGDINSPKFLIFNSETNVQEFLPENTIAAAFSPDAKKIIYFQKQEGKLSGDLITKELAGTKQKSLKILSFNQIDFNLNWILPETVILTPKPSAFLTASAWSINIKNKTFKSLWPIDLSGLMINWSVDGRTNGKLGLQFFNNKGEEGGKNFLVLIDEKGERKANLDFLTLPEKCFFAEPKIYCAVPLEIPKKVVLPDDYFKKAVYFRDYLYQVDIGQNSILDIFSASEPIIDAVNLGVLGNKLLFVNRYNDRLYGLEL